MIDRVEKLIRLLADKCLSWIGEDDKGNTVLVDPIEKEPIGHHYALSHFAAAMIVGFQAGDAEYEAGLEVLRSVIKRWDSDSQAKDFHADFNNMALCIIAETLAERGDELELVRSARETVLRTQDSKNKTINWLPMRMYVNWCRLQWTGQQEYAKKIADAKALIVRATNKDWLIEDRLPKSKSYNLQYNVATVALLEYYDLHCAQTSHLDDMVSALATCVGPDGDINYLGRGCNQIFAWGLWVYLLASRGHFEELERALGYLTDSLPDALAGDNLLLSKAPGSAQLYWWDYHYVSVYMAHLLMWLVLAKRDVSKRNNPLCRGEVNGGETGISVTSNDDYFCVLFDGRKEYWAESGPIVAQIWTERHGVLSKGGLGPWLMPFGTKYSNPMSIFNFFGLISLKQGPVNAFVHRVCERLSMPEPYQYVSRSVEPLFCAIGQESSDDLSLTFSMNKLANCVMNMPLLSENAINDISVFANGAPCKLRYVGRIATQYGEAFLYQTLPCRSRCWKVIVRSQTEQKV